MAAAAAAAVAPAAAAMVEQLSCCDDSLPNIGAIDVLKSSMTPMPTSMSLHPPFEYLMEKSLICNKDSRKDSARKGNR